MDSQDIAPFARPAPAGPVRIAWFSAVALAAVLVVARLAIYLAWQLPAPMGDGVLFASVANYHCATGRFETPIFPLDPTGAYRYTWHGIGHPALLSWLNPDCSSEGAFLALTLVLAASLALVWAITHHLGARVWLALAVTVFALQAKQGFRPETTTVLWLLLCAALRARQQWSWWTTATGVLAWIHPTVFILYAAYSALCLRVPDWRALWLSARAWLPAALLAQALLLWLYPFPLADLLQGLSLQGQSFWQRSDGSVFTYLVRSDFFPLFGVAFVLVFALSVRRRVALLALLPLIWFYGVRVPPAYYNLVPLFVVMLLDLLLDTPAQNSPWPWRATQAALWASALLALSGLSQSVLRDAASRLQYRSTLADAHHHLKALEKQGLAVCELPAFFTLVEPARAFSPSMSPRWGACDQTPAAGRRDLVLHSHWHARPDAAKCEPLPTPPAPAWLPALFRSDSGYSFVICPHRPESSGP